MHIKNNVKLYRLPIYLRVLTLFLPLFLMSGKNIFEKNLIDSWLIFNYFYLCTPIETEGIAQLVRASVCGTEGRGFEPHYPPQKTL